MKLVIDSDMIKEPLKVLYSVAGKNAGPLANCNLRSWNGKMQWRAANSDAEAVYETGVTNEEYSITVPIARLYNAVKSARPVDSVILDSDSGSLVVSVGNATHEIALQPIDKYRSLGEPQLNASNDLLGSFSIPHPTLKKAIASIEKCIPKHDIRPYLNGLCIDLHHTSPDAMAINFVGSDGHRLGLYETHLAPSSNNDANFIIPLPAVAALHKMLDTKSNNKSDKLLSNHGEQPSLVAASFTSTHGKFVIRGATLITKLLDGKYPDYKRLLPSNPSNPSKHCTLDKKLLKGVLTRAWTASNDRLRIAKLYFNNDILVVSVGSDYGESIAVSCDGVDVAIGYNIQYLLDVISSVDSTTIEFSFNDHLGPTVITGDENIRYLVMPCKL